MTHRSLSDWSPINVSLEMQLILLLLNILQKNKTKKKNTFYHFFSDDFSKSKVQQLMTQCHMSYAIMS